MEGRSLAPLLADPAADIWGAEGVEAAAYSQFNRCPGQEADEVLDVDSEGSSLLDPLRGQWPPPTHTAVEACEDVESVRGRRGACAAVLAAASAQEPQLFQGVRATRSWMALAADDVTSEVARWHGDCFLIPRDKARGYMGFSVRTMHWRYTVWLRWDGESEAGLWDDCEANATTTAAAATDGVVFCARELYAHSPEEDLSDFEAFEQRNLAAWPEHAETARRLHAQLRAQFERRHAAAQGGKNEAARWPQLHSQRATRSNLPKSVRAALQPL